MKKIILFLFLSIFVFSACTTSHKEEEKDKEAKSIGNDFAFDFFHEMLDEEENVFVSPYSLETALTMAYIGADSETKEEMARALQLKGIDIEEVKENSLNLKKQLEESEDIELSVANALYLKENFPFLDSYINDGENYFQAEVNHLPENGSVINDWAAENTNNKISEIIDPGPIDQSVIAYLLNAIYFNANWQNQFNQDKTSQRTFYGVGEEFETDMMNQKSNYYHLNKEDIKAVKLDYQNDNYSFYAFMPDDLSQFHQDFNRDYFNDLKDQMENNEIILYLPKFILEKDMGLNQALKNLGIKQAFNESLADFSNMVDLDSIGENVFISSVFQSTFIEVEEQGTEAAAVTGIGMRATSAPTDPPEVIEFNQPFIFLIEEKESNTILFMGQLANPNKKNKD